MDGSMKQLIEFFNDLSAGGKIDVGETVVQALKDTIDEEFKEFDGTLKSGIPRFSGGLAESLTVTKSDSPSYYGYHVEFAGTAPNGEPYEKLANILNYGAEGAGATHDVIIPATHFVTNAIHKLKGLDAKAYKRAVKQLNKKGV